MTQSQQLGFGNLPLQERELLDRALGRRVRTLGPRKDIISDGDKPSVVNLVLEGWAMRYKTLPDGRRQILSFFFAGDICDANVYLLEEMDHSVGTLTNVRIAEISQADFEELERTKFVSKALWCRELTTMAIQREWTTNLGQRNAHERLAHLICEIHCRLAAIGQVEGNRFLWPLTQSDLADATGLTPVHVNRTLQRLRREALIELKNRHMTVLDPKGLQTAAQFNPVYLHF